MPKSERLRAVTPSTQLTNGGLPFDSEEAAAKAHNRKDLILSRDLSEREAHRSPVWLDFADGDQKRLDEYVEKTFRFGKNKFGYDTMMGIFVPEDEVERAVVLSWLLSRSRAFGDFYLDSGYSRFVGGTSWE